MTIQNLSNSQPTLLITGSEGSLSQWIIDKIANQYHIVGVDNCSRYGLTDRKRNYEFVIGELCDQPCVDAIFQKYKPQYVLHCAAQIYGVVGFHKYSADILGSNATSTQCVLSAAAKHSVKKVAYLSSSMVYERATQFPLTESMTDWLPCPHTGYGLSKLFGERLLIEYHQQYDMNYVIWRPFNLITPLEPIENEPGIAHVFTDFIKKIAIDRCESVEIFGDGNQVRCFTWINDVANIIAHRSWSDDTDKQIYNVGSETPTRIIDLARAIWNRCRPGESFKAHFVTNYKDDVITRIPDCSKAITIGWQHSKSLDQLIDICLNQIKK
jgi:nucleoside-diphosphate-sugar epimerase